MSTTLPAADFDPAASQNSPALVEAAVDPALEREVLQKVYVKALWFSGILALIITILVPIPMYVLHPSHTSLTTADPSSDAGSRPTTSSRATSSPSGARCR